MNEKEAREIAQKYYNDPFARLTKDGERGWVFAPSLLGATFGAAVLVIEKKTGLAYELPSGYIGYHDLALEDFETRQGMFQWPENGGVPLPNREALLIRKIEDAKREMVSDVTQARYCADLLAELARDVYALKLRNNESADKHFREAVHLQRQYIHQWSPNLAQTPVEKYVWFLNRERRSDEAKVLEEEFQKLLAGSESSRGMSTTTAQTGRDDELAQASKLLEQAADLEDSGQYEMAIESYRQSIAIVKKSARTEETEFALLLAYYGLGSLYLKRNDFLNAVATLGDAVSLYKTSLSKKPLQFAFTGCVQAMAQCLHHLGRSDEVEELTKLQEL